jgi:GAF domain-containing protein
MFRHASSSLLTRPAQFWWESASMQADLPDVASGDDRLFETLVRILSIQALELQPALDQACAQVNDALQADKTDVFLYEPETQSLVAQGTSQTPMGQRQHELGLDRQPLAIGGPAAAVFQTGEPQLVGHAEDDSDQIPGVVCELGVRSEMDVPLVVNGERRGVLQVDAKEPKRFTERDLRFLQAVAQWIGLVTQRSELIEQRTHEAQEQGKRLAADELAELTRRQQEISVSVAEGLTNEEISERLVLVPGTVANHMEHCLSRLGLKNRTQLGVWAVEHGLYRSGRQDE